MAGESNLYESSVAIVADFEVALSLAEFQVFDVRSRLRRPIVHSARLLSLCSLQPLLAESESESLVGGCAGGPSNFFFVLTPSPALSTTTLVILYLLHRQYTAQAIFDLEHRHCRSQPATRRG